MISCGLVSALLAISAQPAEASGGTLTLPRALATALRDAPSIRARMTHVAEARARRQRAELWTQRNPSIEGAVGPRFKDGTSSIDYEAALSIPIEIGGQRSARIAEAEASEREQQARVEDLRRNLLGDVARIFSRSLYARARARLAAERLALSAELLRAARDRESAGDVSVFEVNLAESEAARAESAAIAEQSTITQADLALLMVLGLPATASIAGDLADRRWIDAALAAESKETRADIVVAKAEVDRAEAQRDLAKARAVPDLELRAIHAREEDANIVLGGLSVELPLFVRAQGTTEAAEARTARAQIELEIAERSAVEERRAARRYYAAAVAAAEALSDVAVRRARDNERLARESYQAGKIDLPALLIIRRDALETRLEHIDRLFDAALAGIDAWVAEGAPLKEEGP